jgi:uracil phosphoribosyltransferase
MNKDFPNFSLVDHSLIKRDISMLRDEKTSPEIFRNVVKRISVILAAEVSKDLKLTKTKIKTPLEITTGYKLAQDVIIIPVLRAGLGMLDGFLEIIPDAKVGHIGLQRDEETLQPTEYYFKIPKKVGNSKLILVDPMLATGGSASQALRFLKKKNAKNYVLVCLVAAPEGIKKLLKDHPDVKIFGAALDRGLNNKGYILPGLGDAGDRTFGTL